MLRIGQGFDLHRLVPNRKLILGGLEIPFEKGLLGHSDADVLVHTIIDALIGAAAIGDIGTFFPDTNIKFQDIDSCILLKKTLDRIITETGYKINNIDSTVIIESPRLSPYINSMRQNIASVLGIEINQINIKAKTSEGIGIVGTGEAVIAEAVVLLIK